MALPRLDMVVRLTAPAVEVFVDHARRSGSEVDDDEAAVSALRPGLEAGDDVLDAGPAGGTIVKFLVAPHLLPARRARVTTRSAGFQRLDMAAQRHCGADAKQEVDARRTPEIQHCRRAIVAVGADQNLDARPGAADLVHQTTQEVACLGTGRASGRMQHGGDETALAVEHDNRLQASFVVVGVE